jgi:nickel/cobalt exporter
MENFTELLRQGAGNIWLFAFSAIVLGALHGLEPGHSKTMMAAFIIAVHGTVKQAVLLGLSATLSHTLVVWLVAIAGLYVGMRGNGETSEPYFRLISATLMLALGFWMLARVWRSTRKHSHGHEHHEHHHAHDHNQDHHTASGQDAGLERIVSESRDAHELAHAHDIQKRFANRQVTTGQIVLFGLVGGLIPCPAAITVLLICLQLKQVSLGVLLVFCFSIGLAATMVAAGVAAALASRHAVKRFSRLGELARYAPALSGILVICLGLYMGWQGYEALAGRF